MASLRLPEAMADLEAGKGKRFDSTDDLFKGLGREVKFRRYHTADYLKTEHDIAASLDAVRDDGDLALIEAARDDVNRVRADRRRCRHQMGRMILPWVWKISNPTIPLTTSKPRKP
ncbi:MAG: hypothetical protein GX920_03080 [Micrococcus sp.]|nr:hypothetical protein [Micrococcus sp.]